MSVVRAAVAKPGRDRITRYDDPAVGEENFVNQVLSRYNDFGQLTAQYQAHGGAVNTSTTPNVEYVYADGSANTIRPTSLTYPNGRVLTYSYGTTDEINDAASRIEALIDDDSTPLAEYEYLGLGSIVEVDYPQPDLRYRLFDPGLSGDIYTSLDRFGRVIDCHWYDYDADASAARIQYGYDRASNRIWREDPVAAANGKRFDELYAYDGLHRLKEMQRGTLNGGKDAITNLQFEQCWSLDATGNWSGFRSDDDGTGWSLVQQRTANEVNEITGISETTGPSWATPSYDPAGNMTTLPQPSDPTATYTATYDAWNRLVKLTDGEDTVQENQYDARRFRIVRKDYAEGTLDETRHFFYTAGWQSIEERLDTETDPDRQYVWGLRYIDDCVLRDRPDLEERLYGLQDGNWNMIAIADEGGDVQERYAYSAYGVPMFLSAAFVAQGSSSFAWETLYAGYRWDTSSGMFSVRFRYLHSNLGIWIARDPIAHRTSSTNTYEYVSFQPVSTTDPLGLIQVGIGVGAGSTTIVPTAFHSVGLSISWTEQGFAYTGGPFPITCTWCSTATFSALTGVGFAAVVGGFFAVTVGPGTPSSGFSVTTGAAFGSGAGVGFGAPLEVAVDVDAKTGVTTISVGKLPGIGIAFYGVVRVSGNCTECSAHVLWGIPKRIKGVEACIQRVLGGIAKAHAHLAAKPIKPNSKIIIGE